MFSIFSMFNRSDRENTEVSNESSKHSKESMQSETDGKDISDSPNPERNSFDQELVSRQRHTLEKNLDKLGVPKEEQKEIFAKRDTLSDNYHEMPLEEPSECYWLLENTEVPPESWRTQHHIDALGKCMREVRASSIGKQKEEQTSSLQCSL